MTNHVRLVEGVAARPIESVRIARREDAAAGAVHVSGYVECAAKLHRRLVTAASPNLRAEQRGRSLSIDQEIGELFDVRRIADGFRRRAIGARLGDARALDRHLGVEHVARNFQIARSRRAIDRFAKRHGNHVGDALGMRHAGGEFRDRRHDIDVGQVLQRAHLVLAERALAADHEQRTFGAEGIGDPRHGVGRARSSRGHDTADFAALARIAVRRMCGDLLVAHVDDLDPLIETAVVNIDDMAAAQRPDHFDTLVLERLRDQVTTRDHRSGRFFFCFGSW